MQTSQNFMHNSLSLIHWQLYNYASKKSLSLIFANECYCTPRDKEISLLEKIETKIASFVYKKFSRYMIYYSFNEYPKTKFGIILQFIFHTILISLKIKKDIIP